MKIEIKKIKDLGSIFNGNSINERIKKDKYTGKLDGRPFIATKDVDFDSHSINYDNGVKIPFSEKSFKIAHKDSVLICMEGGSAGKKVAFNTEDVCFGNKLVAIEANNTCNPRYIFYYLLSDQFGKSFKNLMNGVIGGVSINKFKEIDIPVPSLSEQNKIVKTLDDAFEKLKKVKQNTERNLQNSKELFESYLNDVFSNPGMGWEQKTLEEISFDFGRGKSKHRPRNDKKLYGGIYPFIQTGDIRNSSHFITEYTQTYNEIGLAQSKLWPKGTICITIAANIAETGILTFDACFPDSVIGIMVDPNKAESGFVEYLLQFFKTLIQSKGKGSAQANINMGTFENQKFPFPSVLEQRKLIQKLDQLSEKTQKLESLYKQKLESIEELKKSILSKAFSRGL